MEQILKRIYSRLTFEYRRLINYFRAYILIAKTFYYKECYFGPFVGEFGHLLSHIVPFISYLHSKGVKIHYCGPDIHSPYFVNDKGVSIIFRYHKLRDFYNEVSPMCNDQLFPEDVGLDISSFIFSAKNSGLPFWDIRTKGFYWDVFCKWEYLNGFIKTYKQKKVKIKENTIVVFARKKGNPSHVRGEDWDFQELVDEIKLHTDKIIVLGHPAFSHNIKESENVEVLLTSDNSLILQKCKQAKLIINQLSGTHYLGVYTDTRVLLLLKGKINYSNIIKDNKLRKIMKEKHPLEYAYSLEEVKNIVKKISN